MATRTAFRILTALLMAMAVGWAVAGPVAAAPVHAATEERIDYASGTLDGTDPRSGRSVHGVFTVFAPSGEEPFGTTDFFVGGDSGIAYECVTEQRVRAGIHALEDAFAAGVLRMECNSPVGLPARTGYALVGLHWQGEGPVEPLVFERPPCTEYLDIRHAAVTGGVLLVVPGVAVTEVRPHDHPADELRKQVIVCT
jgi:hypothetical protein